MCGPTTLSLLQLLELKWPGTDPPHLLITATLCPGIYHLPTPTMLFTSSHNPKTEQPVTAPFLQQLGQSWGVPQHHLLDEATGPPVQPALPVRSGHKGRSVCWSRHVSWGQEMALFAQTLMATLSHFSRFTRQLKKYPFSAWRNEYYFSSPLGITLELFQFCLGRSKPVLSKTAHLTKNSICQKEAL